MRLGLKDKIIFGKYKGLTIQNIILKDPKYLYWATENIKWFALTTEAQDALPDKAKLYSPFLGHRPGPLCPCDDCSENYEEMFKYGDSF